LVNALSNKKISLVELLIVNTMVSTTVWLIENRRIARHESNVLGVYDRLQFLSPSHHDELLRELKQRTGLPVSRFEIQEVNLLRDTVNIMAHFHTDGLSAATHKSRTDKTFREDGVAPSYPSAPR